MHQHLRVAVLPVAYEDVARSRDELVARVTPPLNLSGLPRDKSRSALSRLRGLLRRPVRPGFERGRPSGEATDAEESASS